MIHIIIPVHNRIKLTLKCLRSLKQQINFKKLNIFIVDDGSTDKTRHYVKKNFPKVNILNGDGSLYWGGAIRFGIECALKNGNKKDWILILSNDVELKCNTIQELIFLADKYKRKALVGALSVNFKDKATIIKSGTIVRSWFFNITEHIYKGQKLKTINNLKPVEVDFLTGRCLLHPIEVFSKAGNYNSQRFRHYGGDDEFTMRVKKYGFSSFLCPSSVVYLHENLKIYKKKNIRNLYYYLFNIKSSLNILNKFYLSIAVVPIHSIVSYYIIGILKSFYLFFKIKR